MFSRIQDFALLVTNQTMNLRIKSTIQTNQVFGEISCYIHIFPHRLAPELIAVVKLHWVDTDLRAASEENESLNRNLTGLLFVTAGVEASFAWKANVSIVDGRFSNSGERGRFKFPWIKLSWCHCLETSRYIQPIVTLILFMFFFLLVDTYSISDIHLITSLHKAIFIF